MNCYLLLREVDCGDGWYTRDEVVGLYSTHQACVQRVVDEVEEWPRGYSVDLGWYVVVLSLDGGGEKWRQRLRVSDSTEGEGDVPLTSPYYRLWFS